MLVEYEGVLQDLVAEAHRENEVIGLLLTGSLARGDALPGTDIDLRFILDEGHTRPFRSQRQGGVLVERGYADAASAAADIETHPMHVYAYLDGRILYDPQGVLEALRKQAQLRFDHYRTPEAEQARIAFLLQCSRDKIRVARMGGDVLKAAFVTATASWQIMEGLWAANHRPLPPNSSVYPHLGDLSGPTGVETLFGQLFLADTQQRMQVALELIDWCLDRLSSSG